MDKTVVYCGTQNHYPFMEVAAKSLLYHTPVDRVYFLIEDDIYPWMLPDMISTINVSDQQWFRPDGANYKSDWTYMAYVRIALTKILPDCHAALYMDTDTLVLHDISPLLDANLDGYCFGMIAEDIGDVPIEMCKAFSVAGTQLAIFQSDSPRPEYCIRPYYNSGVMMMNLDEMRRTGMDDILIDEINNVYHKYPDQDAINLMCRDKILPVPLEYNVIPSLCPDFPQEQIRIKHFAADKPLWKSSLWQQYRRIPWKTVMERQAMLHE